MYGITFPLILIIEVIELEMQFAANKMPVKKSLYERFTSQEAVLFYIALPLLLLTFIFNYLPLFGWSYAFVDYKPGLSVFKTNFAGLRYFLRLFEPGSGFIEAIRNTLTFGFLNIFISPLPIIFALLLAEVKSVKYSKFIQTVTSLPNFISWVLVFGIFFAFFSSDGFVNTLLIDLKVISQPIDYLGDSSKVYLMQTIIAAWKGLGWNAIIYIAAMTSIDSELYDAADVDGANRFNKMWHITIPGLMPTYIVLLLLAVSGILNTGFEQYFVFRNPLIVDRIDVIDTYVYTQGISNAEYAYATAVGIFKTAVSIVLLFTVNSIAKRTRGQSIV